MRFAFALLSIACMILAAHAYLSAESLAYDDHASALVCLGVSGAASLLAFICIICCTGDDTARAR